MDNFVSNSRGNLSAAHCWKCYALWICQTWHLLCWGILLSFVKCCFCAPWINFTSLKFSHQRRRKTFWGAFILCIGWSENPARWFHASFNCLTILRGICFSSYWKTWSYSAVKPMVLSFCLSEEENLHGLNHFTHYCPIRLSNISFEYIESCSLSSRLLNSLQWIVHISF